MLEIWFLLFAFCFLLIRTGRAVSSRRAAFACSVPSRQAGFRQRSDRSRTGRGIAPQADCVHRMAAFLAHEAHDNPLSAGASESELPSRQVTDQTGGRPPRDDLSTREEDSQYETWGDLLLLVMFAVLAAELIAMPIDLGRCVWSQRHPNGTCKATAAQVCNCSQSTSTEPPPGKCFPGTTAVEVQTSGHWKKMQSKQECSAWCTELGSRTCEAALFVCTDDDGQARQTFKNQNGQILNVTCAEAFPIGGCKSLLESDTTDICCASCSRSPRRGRCYAYSGAIEAARYFMPAKTCGDNASMSWLCIPAPPDQESPSVMQRLDAWVGENLHKIMSSIATLTRLTNVVFKYTLRRVEDKILHWVGYGGATSLFGTVTASRQAATAAKLSQAASTTGHDFAATSWDAIAAPSATPPTSWEQARSAQRLSMRQALWSCGAKLLLWHWSQPLSYLYAFAYYYCELPLYELKFKTGYQVLAPLPGYFQKFGLWVAIREVTYFGSTFVALILNPAYLLLELGESETMTDRWIYFLAPHHYVTMCITRWATRRDDAVGSRRQQIVLVATYLIWMFQSVCDYVSLGLLTWLVMATMVHNGFWLVSWLENMVIDSTHQPQPPFSLLIACWLTSWGVILGTWDWGLRCWRYTRRGSSTRSVDVSTRLLESPDTTSGCTRTFGKFLLRLSCCPCALVLLLIAVIETLVLLVSTLYLGWALCT